MPSDAALPTPTEALQPLSPEARLWFGEALGAPTPVQARGWAAIARGEHALLLAPTGSGKTLAAFLYALDRLAEPADTPGVRVLYVSPLKALVYDVEKNLRAPLAGLEEAALRLGRPRRRVTVGIRTGDTPQSERTSLVRRPPDVLVTTPESLFLMLLSGAAATLATVETVIVDEVHALAGTKRGAHLALSLERLALLTSPNGEERSSPSTPPGAGRKEAQRIGLSATVSPPEEVGAYLGGDRPMTIVDTLTPPRLTLRVEQLTPESRATRDGVTDTPPSIWPALVRRVRELLEGRRSVIVFVNSRGSAERLARELNESAGRDDTLPGGGAAEPPLLGGPTGDDQATRPEIALAHHGSLSRQRREDIEGQLKTGRILTIVATSSLELGIDMGLVELVILIESPGAVSRGLQRVGRAGHGVGETSHGVLLPKHRGDLLECAVVAAGMLTGAIEPVRVPRNCLDVLAQQLVADAANGPTNRDAMLRWVRRAYNYRTLTEAGFDATLDMLAGRYPSTEFADLRPKLDWDRSSGGIRARRGARLVAVANAGTIPDRGLYGVYLGAGGPRVGELDEEMVYEARPGQTFVLGASTWRISEITRDRVLVTPAPGEPGELPFWKGATPGRPATLGRAVGAFIRHWEATGELPEVLDARAKEELTAHLTAQREATGALPSDRTVVVETYPDELGDLRVNILSPFGSPIHAPWALCLEAELSAAAGFAVSALYSDDGISLRFARPPDALPRRWAPHPADVRDLVLTQLGHSALFAGLFREAAGRALLLPRRSPNRRTPLWSQRKKAQALLAVAREHAQFPIVLEAYRTALEDLFDLEGLTGVLRDIAAGHIRLVEVTTERPSPFARALAFDYVATWLYEGDAPLAERRAQALTLDTELLRELLGEAALVDVLDPAVVEETEAELQGLAESWRARDRDDALDLLRRLGDLSPAELAARCAFPGDPRTRGGALAETGADPAVTPTSEPPTGVLLAWPSPPGDAQTGRPAPAPQRLIAPEDAGLYRDALGCVVPEGLPAAFLGPRPDGLFELLGRWARTHGPFTLAALAQRWCVSPEQLLAATHRLLAAGRLVAGRFVAGPGPQYCDSGVLRLLRRRSMDATRGALGPVAPEVYARFLQDWHALSALGEPEAQLEAALLRLEGAALSLDELERRILPARVPGFRAQQLDALVQSGAFVWCGAGEGRLVFQRREGALWPTPDEPDGPLERTVLEHLRTRGASFLFELKSAAGSARLEDLAQCLVDLAWRGLVTNDSLAPLRAASVGIRAHNAARVAGGRWSAAPTSVGAAQALRTRAQREVQRHGVLLRDAVDSFAELYPVLRALDERGLARRGYFVDEAIAQELTPGQSPPEPRAAGSGPRPQSLPGERPPDPRTAGSGFRPQFAAPGAVDRLRAARGTAAAGRLVVLAATDPASPWGASLPWPGSNGTPRREPYATVALLDGRPVYWLGRGGRQLLAFDSVASAESTVPMGRPEAESGSAAPHCPADALRALATSHAVHGTFVLERVGELPLRASTLAPDLARAGFDAHPRGLSWG